MTSSKLSQTARSMPAAAAARDDTLVLPLEHLPHAAQQSVVRSLLKSGLIEEFTALDGQPVWRMSEDGERLALRALPAAGDAVTTSDSKRTPAEDSMLDQATGPEWPVVTSDGLIALSSAARPNLRSAASAILAAWDATANGPPCLAPHFETPRNALYMAPGGLRPRAPRLDTKRFLVLGLLYRPEGATVAQVVDATDWARHTVHGFFAGLKKAGLPVEVLDRVRQVGPGKQGAVGSYKVYCLAEAS